MTHDSTHPSNVACRWELYHLDSTYHAAVHILSHYLAHHTPWMRRFTR